MMDAPHESLDTPLSPDSDLDDSDLAAPERSASGFGGPFLRVLLISDDPEVGRLAREGLSGARLPAFEVSDCTTLNEALDELAQSPSDAILLDISSPGSPGLSGIEALRIIRLHAPALPVVVLLSEHDEPVSRRALSAGALDYLLKEHLGSDLLARSVRYSVERRRAEVALQESRRSEQALRESEQRYRQMFEKNQGIKLIIDPETGAIVDANPAAEQYYGYSAGQLQGMRITDINTLPLEEVGQEMARARDELRTYFQFRHRLASGEIRDVEVYSSPVEIGGRRLLYSIIHDVTERSIADEKRRISEQRFASILEIAEDAIISVDSDLRITLFNLGASKIFGYQPEDVIGQTLDLLLPSRFSDTHRQHISLFGESDEASRKMGQRLSIVGQRKDGTEFPAEASISRLDLRDGRVYTVILRDITEQKRAEAQILNLNTDLERRVLERTAQLQAANKDLAREVEERTRLEEQVRKQAEALKEEYERLAALVAHVDVGLAMLNAEGRFSLVNEAWLRMTGFDKNKVVGHRYADFAGGAAEESQRHVDHVLSSGEALQLRELFLTNPAHPEGAYFDRSLVPVRGAGGRITGVLTAAIDVNEKVHARQELETQKRVLEAILNGVPVGIAMFDRGMRIISANDSWARISGTDVQSILGRSAYDVAPGMRERQDMHDRVLAGEDIEVQGIMHRLPEDGSTHYYDIHLRPIRDAQGAITGILSATVDVTERHELDRQKDEFIALASHELRSPMTTIKASAQLGQRYAETAQDERLGRVLATIAEQSDRLNRLVNDLLEVSRIQGSSLTLYRDEFDLRDVASAVVRGAKMTAPDFDFATRLPSDAVVVHADRQRVEQVLTNLLHNAIKYSGDARSAEVGMHVPPSSDEVVTYVRDYGVGIPSGQQANVFDRFFRGSNVAGRQRTGLGLGLYISRNIVTSHGGHMWLESAEGQGSTFYFSLPLARS